DIVLNENLALVVYNNAQIPENSEQPLGPRTPLSIAVGKGSDWQHVLDLETGLGEYSYPAVIQDQNRIYIAYTFERTNIRVVEFDREEILELAKK
ncbi:MAG: exo-alpha-sialidase, partial [Bdellovibrionales bacterium]|nr:exo-alpha-sialidase [Bdellovibrionales bacterium]